MTSWLLESIGRRALGVFAKGISTGRASDGRTFFNCTVRLMNEPVRLFRFNPSAVSPWSTEPLTVYQPGDHAVIVSLTLPSEVAAVAGKKWPQPGGYHGALEIVVEDPAGNTILRHAAVPPRWRLGLRARL